jgi:hypothetical protein
MTQPKRTLIGFTVLTVIVAAGCVGYQKFHPLAVDDSGEPSVTYIVQFQKAKFGDDTPDNRKAFADALKVPDKAIFRHNMAIYNWGSTNPCDRTDLGDDGLTNPTPHDPCKSDVDMGQQVTQRVGFNNKDNLRKALSYLKKSP